MFGSVCKHRLSLNVQYVWVSTVSEELIKALFQFILVADSVLQILDLQIDSVEVRVLDVEFNLFDAYKIKTHSHRVVAERPDTVDHELDLISSGCFGKIEPQFKISWSHNISVI